MAKIVSLRAENVKRLHAVEIKPEGSNLVVIGGMNAQGKSSVLDSIEMALGGRGTHPPEPIRRGAGKAHIVCVFDDIDLIVERSFTRRGSSLVVKSKDGTRYSSPQTLLEKLYGRIGFDPLAFARMSPREQLETLKSLVGLDFSADEAQRKKLYTSRTMVNRTIREIKAQLDNTTRHTDVPDEEVSVVSLMEELKRRQRINRNNQLETAHLEELNNLVESSTSEVRGLEKRITELQASLERAKASLKKHEKARAEQQEKVKNLQLADEQEVLKQIESAEEVNRKVRENAKHKELTEKLQKEEAKTNELTKKIEEIDKRKARIVAQVKFPIDGLSFDEEGVLYHDLPFEQVSDAEKLRVSVAMGLAMCPEDGLKIMLIRNGSLLDEENLRMIAEMAEEANAQVWMERVGEGEECQVIIEDGFVARK